VIRPAVKEKLHPRNRFRAGYDFAELVAAHRPLASFVRPNAYGSRSIDYADPHAVKALNQALLAHAYGLTWDVPAGYLCPPIPGRCDYVHYVADLLGVGTNGPTRPRGAVSVLDVGTGANAIYPLIGASEYGWRVIGSDIDPVAVRWARRVIADNPAVADLIECRLQSSASECFTGIVRAGETFDVSMCNPPFHASADEATEGTRRKRRHLGGTAAKGDVRNFGGTAGELWCEGGELGFVRRMIAQSAARPSLCRWFTTLVSHSTHLPRLQAALRDQRVSAVRTIDMTHGQKRTRILAWTFGA
jgi:23S rRNA (adenine1618-N6)-methyltransferase